MHSVPQCPEYSPGVAPELQHPSHFTTGEMAGPCKEARAARGVDGELGFGTARATGCWLQDAALCQLWLVKAFEALPY